MLVEITQGADFVCRLLNKSIEPEPLQHFHSELIRVLTKRYESHWDTNRPNWGNGYRALNNFNGILDCVFAEAAQSSSVPAHIILNVLPRDLCLWIDPFNVSYRVGDHGSINTLFEDKSRGRITLRSPDAPINTQFSAASLASQLNMVAAAAYPSPRSSPKIFAPGPRAVRISPPPSPPGKAMSKMLIAVN